jgi:hypothetical protein
MGQGSAGTGRRGLRADAGVELALHGRASPVGRQSLTLAGNGRMEPDSLARLLKGACGCLGRGKSCAKGEAQVPATRNRKAPFPGLFE